MFLNAHFLYLDYVVARVVAGAGERDIVCQRRISGYPATRAVYDLVSIWGQRCSN